MEKQTHKFREQFAILLLVLWVGCICTVVYLHRPAWRYHYWPYVNVLPIYNFVSLIPLWISEGSFGFWKILPWLYNLMIYVPPGFIIPTAFSKRRNYITLLKKCVIFSVTVNLIRLISKCGSFDVDDILLNLVGFTVGYTAFLMFQKIRCRSLHKKYNQNEQPTDIN